MDHVHWSGRPALRTPVVIAAFTGWNDAGDAASSALRHLVDTWDADVFAEVDPEEFVDYQSTRPQVRLVDGTTREVVWPATELYSASTAGGDVVLVLGPEPQLKWRAYCREMVEVAEELDASMVITWARCSPTCTIAGRSPSSAPPSDADVVERYGLQRSRYEGPTGIVGCLHDACSRRRARLAVALGRGPRLPPRHGLAQGHPGPRAAGRRLRRHHRRRRRPRGVGGGVRGRRSTSTSSATRTCRATSSGSSA